MCLSKAYKANIAKTGLPAAAAKLKQQNPAILACVGSEMIKLLGEEKTNSIIANQKSCTAKQQQEKKKKKKKAAPSF